MVLTIMKLSDTNYDIKLKIGHPKKHKILVKIVTICHTKFQIG